MMLPLLSMICPPCRSGISHNEAEHIELEYAVPKRVVEAAEGTPAPRAARTIAKWSNQAAERVVQSLQDVSANE